jgi:hypothetical protein
MRMAEIGATRSLPNAIRFDCFAPATYTQCEHLPHVRTHYGSVFANFSDQ